MIATVSAYVLPAVACLALGWFGREWFELRRIARMASAYDADAEIYGDVSIPPGPR